MRKALAILLAAAILLSLCACGAKYTGEPVTEPETTEASTEAVPETTAETTAETTEEPAASEERNLAALNPDQLCQDYQNNLMVETDILRGWTENLYLMPAEDPQSEGASGEALAYCYYIECFSLYDGLADEDYDAFMECIGEGDMDSAMQYIGEGAYRDVGIFSLTTGSGEDGSPITEQALVASYPSSQEDISRFLVSAAILMCTIDPSFGQLGDPEDTEQSVFKNFFSTTYAEFISPFVKNAYAEYEHNGVTYTMVGISSESETLVTFTASLPSNS
ncbi:MAG: hypothetical protein SPI15_04340 [Candidatus Faecousia sp.]|nr:hypothetical protein [Clostridiales bacterium]MDY6180062.1 hypothetical protein [Candidatus Faecousia sp.]